MAAKKTTTTVVEGEEETAKPAAEELDEDVLRALMEIEGVDEIRWQVWRRSGADTGYIKTYSTPELSIDRIAEECGPGRYQIKGIRADGTYKKSGIINIAKADKPDPLRGVADLLKPQPGVTADQNVLLQLLMTQMTNSTNVVTAALARPEPTKSEFPWAALAAAIPPSLVALKEFFQNKADPMKQMTDAITLMEKLRGKDDKDGPTGWADLVRDGVKSIPSVLHALKNAPPVTPQQPQAAPALPEPPEAVPAPENEDMNVRLIHWLRTSLEKLIAAAQRNGNAELYAELLIEELPPELPEPDVLTLLSRSDWFEMLCMFDSRVQPYRGWFEELRECALDTLRPDEESYGPQTDRNADRRSESTDRNNLRDVTDGQSVDA